MNPVKLLLLAATVALAIAPSPTSVWADDGADVVANFKGHTELNRAIRERLIDPKASFDFGVYLGNDSQLLNLLGVFQSNGLNQEFVNGVPNTLNTLLYHLAMSDFARDIAKLCDSPAPKTAFSGAVSASFAQAVHPLCSWPAASARTDSVLLAFYLGMMSYDAPEDDFGEWKAFFQGPAYAKAKPEQAVAAMSLTLLMNPYFLLQE